MLRPEAYEDIEDGPDRASGIVPTTAPVTALGRAFRLLALAWEDAADPLGRGRLIEALLARGARVLLVTARGPQELLAMISGAIGKEQRRRLYVAAHGGAEMFGFDFRGEPERIDTALSAMEYLFRAIATPHGIAPEDVLIAGGAWPLPTPEGEGATVLSARPEQIGEVLAQQLAIEERLGLFAPPRDPAWAIEEPGFDVAREHEIESLLAISNGYLGVRGSLAEGSSVSRPATFLAGAFEPSNDISQVPELVIAPDWGRLRFTIEGEPFSVEGMTMERHRRTLDMRRGLLLREGVASGSAGHTTLLRTMHLASLANRHLLLEAVEIVPQNYSGTVEVDAILSGEVQSGSGASHWAKFEPHAMSHGPMLVGTTHAGMRLALASHTTAADPSAEISCQRQQGLLWASERCTLHVRLAEPSSLQRTVGIFTSRDAGEPVARAYALGREAERHPFEAQMLAHQTAWAERWRRADIEIDGAPTIERAVRFALYHLIAAANPEDPRCSIGARALAGEAYRGHVFWDTEIFLLPFYAHCYPEAARALLLYRHRTLDGARRKAKRFGYEGALYAWESADTGDETTPDAVVSPFGRVLAVLSGREEQHISADVAYAVCAYARATGDLAFLAEEGTEILVETARFWASRARDDKGDGLFHIDRVIGPDEYHESIDDNAYTNWMARSNLLQAEEVARGVGSDEARALGVTRAELSRWHDVAWRMYLGFDPHTGLIEQFRGFHELEYIDVAAYAPRTVPMDVLLGRERTQASQVVKQSDVVQLVSLLWDELPPSVRRKNFLHYEPRTGHGSSLSPGTHALVAARLGMLDTATRYLEQTAAIDLGNNMGNAAGGVHAAAMGSLWQAVAFGVAGLSPAPDHLDTLAIDPRLLPAFRHLGVPFIFRGRSLTLHVVRDAIEVHMREGRAPIVLRAPGGAGTRREVQAEPGRKYVSRRCAEAFSEWEEVGR